MPIRLVRPHLDMYDLGQIETHPLYGYIYVNAYREPHDFSTTIYQIRRSRSGELLIGVSWRGGNDISNHRLRLHTVASNCLPVWVSTERGLDKVCKSCPVQLTCLG